MSTLPRRISSVMTGTNRQLVQSNKRVPVRQLVVNLTTGEIRKGPGNGWNELAAAGAEDLADVVVRAATTADITIATALNDGDTLDGVELADGDLVLVKDQSAPAQNGIYVVGDVPARATAFAAFNQHTGTLAHVAEGTDNEDRQYLCTAALTGTLGTAAITWNRYTSALQSTVSGLAAAASAGATQRLVVLNADGTLETVTGAQLLAYINP